MITGRLREGIAPGQAIAAVETVATRRYEQLMQDNPDRRSSFRLTAVSLADVRLHPRRASRDRVCDERAHY